VVLDWEGVNKRVWTNAWTPRSSEVKDALQGDDGAGFEVDLEAVNLKGGLTVAEIEFIG
jgi:hypothetical protein